MVRLVIAEGREDRGRFSRSADLAALCTDSVEQSHFYCIRILLEESKQANHALVPNARKDFRGRLLS